MFQSNYRPYICKNKRTADKRRLREYATEIRK